MSKEIIGDSFKYIVDESFGINKDGFIAIGTESIVYKGLKTKDDGKLQFPCVLKFKPKKQKVDDKIIDCLAEFKAEEWKIFQALQDCRSVVRLDDVIEDLGDFSLVCAYAGVGDLVIDAAGYFCVVEEYIDGWNLDEFCREEFWKLRRLEPLANGLYKKVEFGEFSPEEQQSVLSSYNYDNQLKFQSQILQFMMDLCEIMEFVTEQKNILHLDIKPENIMVTRYAKELVLIDFGRSRQITDAHPYIDNPMGPVDYNQKETHEKLYQYGSLGYAAPECYREPAPGSTHPFSVKGTSGRMSIESDIFSFGVTFWECLNLFELITHSEKTIDIYDLYHAHFLNDKAYCNRDLSLTATSYHQKLENILKKCTRARRPDFVTSDRYYHSYRELRSDLENVMESTPTIAKEEDVKVKVAFKLCGVMCALAIVFLLINGIYHTQDFKIAEGKWDSITANYNETRFAMLSVIADDYLSAAPANKTAEIYDKIFQFVHTNNGTISDYEASLLVTLLQKMGGNNMEAHVDAIMMYADANSFKNISTDVVKLNVTGKSAGYELAVAIYNVEVSKSNIPEAFHTLQQYAYNKDFNNAVIKLRNVLDKDANIQLIMESENMTRQQVISYFNAIG